MISDPAPFIREDYTEFYRELMLKSYNFFKHSSRNGHQTHWFPPECNQLVILDATEAYHRLTNDVRPLFKLFKWYMRTHEPRLFLEPALDVGAAKSWSSRTSFHSCCRWRRRRGLLNRP